jgi:ribosomal-protein-alanine N-acetyltransferase
MLPTLQAGPRLLLRYPAPHDAEALTALARASRRFHAGLASPPRDADAFHAYLARASAPDYEALLLVRRSDGAPLGCIDFSQIFRRAFQSAYAGYWIGAPYAGQGYMTEGLALALTHVFGTLGLHRVETNIQPRNEPSKAVVRRLGFRLEGYSPRYLKIGGRWRDHERWAILREEWRPARRGARR